VANFDPSWRYSWCFYSNKHIVQRGWQILTPHEDKVDFITPVNRWFRGGWQILMWWWSWCADDDDDDNHHHDDWKCGATSGLGRTSFIGSVRACFGVLKCTQGRARVRTQGNKMALTE
jgi:hypothetical protein